MQGKGCLEKRWSGCLTFPTDTTITPPGYLQVYAIALRVPSDLSQISPFTVFTMEGIEGQGSGIRWMGQEAFPKPRKPYWIFKSVPDIKTGWQGPFHLTKLTMFWVLTFPVHFISWCTLQIGIKNLFLSKLDRPEVFLWKEQGLTTHKPGLHTPFFSHWTLLLARQGGVAWASPQAPACGSTLSWDSKMFMSWWIGSFTFMYFLSKEVP